jgi:enterochelin esterase family protein
MTKRIPLLLFAVCSLWAAEKVPTPKLLQMAAKNPNSAEFREALMATLPEADINKGTAFIGEGPDFLWVVDSAAKPSLFVDDEARPPMKQIKGSSLWIETGKLQTGISHTFHYMVDGKRFGGRFDVPAYGPDSYEHPGVPQGKLSEKLVHTSKIYDGMKSDYWIYVPAQYDPKTPAALMVWHDGQGMVDRNGGTRAQNVIDNLIHQKKIPVMISVFISPGDISGSEGTSTYNFVKNFSNETRRTLKDSMRSVAYDTVSDRYPRMLRDELLPEIYAKYNIRKDAYSRGVIGNSSGGISAFNIVWQQPDQFSRVITRIGTYTSIQWIPGVQDGGNVYPNKVRKEPKRNIRVWAQDGSEDIESAHGSWPLQNIQMANSLKLRGYDFHFTFGGGNHSGAHGNAQNPEELTWLWRDYDPAKTEQTYEQDPAEKDKPYFRVKIANR